MVEGGKANNVWYSSFKNSSNTLHSTRSFNLNNPRQLEFLKLEFHIKLEFHKLAFQKSDKLLNILKIVVDCKIFWPKMVVGHFGHPLGINSDSYSCGNSSQLFLFHLSLKHKKSMSLLQNFYS